MDDQAFTRRRLGAIVALHTRQDEAAGDAGHAGEALPMGKARLFEVRQIHRVVHMAEGITVAEADFDLVFERSHVSRPILVT